MSNNSNNNEKTFTAKEMQAEIERLSKVPVSVDIRISNVGGGSAVSPVLAPKIEVIISGGDADKVRAVGKEIARLVLSLVNDGTA